MHLPTPDLSHLTKEDFKHVYEPAEDTFILLDALEADSERIVRFKPFFCAEIGSGSGCVSVFTQQILNSIPTVHFCSDINRIALEATFRTFEKNGLPAPNLIQTSLIEGFRTQMIELLLFNPPYVATEDQEYNRAQPLHDISASWAGGQNGMLLTDRLLENLDSILHPSRGIFYLVAIKQNNPDGIVKRMQVSGFVAGIVLKRRAGCEHLHVIRISRPSAHASLMADEAVVSNAD